jgi:hypothetical protein
VNFLHFCYMLVESWGFLVIVVFLHTTVVGIFFFYDFALQQSYPNLFGIKGFVIVVRFTTVLRYNFFCIIQQYLGTVK